MPETLRTLIVDDEPLAVERLHILCARIAGLTLVGTAADGAGALRLIENLKPDLLLLDIQMPGMDGMAVAQALANRPERPALIFVTAFDQFAVAAFDVAAVDYLLKPVEAERLERAVARIRDRIGEAAPQFARTLDGKAPYEVSGTLDVAVTLAAKAAAASNVPAPVVLLSPACASYDQFKDFEHRGDIFRTLVAGLAGASEAAQ